MRPVRIAETDIDRDRHAHLLRLPDQVVHAGHELRRPGETARLRTFHFHNDQFRLRRRSAVSASFAAPAVSRSDPGHGSPVSAAVRAQRRLYRPFCIQKFIDLFGGVLPVRLIPQRCNPRRPVLIPEIRIGQIDPAVHDADQHASAGQIIRSLLHRIDAGHLPPHVRLEIQTLRLLDKLHFRERGQRFNPVFPDTHHRIVVQELCYRFADLPRRSKTARILDDQIPRPFTGVISHVQFHRAGAFLRGRFKGEVKDVFNLLAHTGSFHAEISFI